MSAMLRWAFFQAEAIHCHIIPPFNQISHHEKVISVHCRSSAIGRNTRTEGRIYTSPTWATTAMWNT